MRFKEYYFSLFSPPINDERYGRSKYVATDNEKRNRHKHPRKIYEIKKETLNLLEARDNWVYHVTFANNLSSIARNGLVPNSNPSTFSGYQAWSRDKNFFSTSLENVEHWIDKIQDIIEHNMSSEGWDSNNFVNQGRIPIVIRFRFNQRPTTNRWNIDTKGYQAGNDYYTNRLINPFGIQWWSGKKWQNIADDNMDIEQFVYKDFDDPGLQDTEEYVSPNELFYWQFRQPYPMPN